MTVRVGKKKGSVHALLCYFLKFSPLFIWQPCRVYVFPHISLFIWHLGNSFNSVLRNILEHWFFNMEYESAKSSFLKIVEISDKRYKHFFNVKCGSYLIFEEVHQCFWKNSTEIAKSKSGVNPIKLFFFVCLFTIKLGHFTINYFFLYVTSMQAYQRKTEKKIVSEEIFL